MPKIGKYKVIIDDIKLSAKENMEIDKKLFYDFKKEDDTIIRLYKWEKSFTYGASQEFSSLGFLYGNGYAKRLTGGGVLLHGHDISYSIITSTRHFQRVSVKRSYEYLCEFLMEFYRSLDLRPKFVKDLNLKLKRSPFCQLGREPYDIVIKNKKIGGNAQKRARDKLLQHGSIPIKKIEHPYAGYSLEDFGIILDEDEAFELLLESFKKTYKE